MTRPLKGERVDQTSPGVIEHGAQAHSTCVVLVGLISIFDAAVEGRLSENLSSENNIGIYIKNYIESLLMLSPFLLMPMLIA